MTEPTPPDDLTETDNLAEPTGNALQPDDPDEQPSQDPGDLPAGTEKGDA
jgi:hypothetical protein